MLSFTWNLELSGSKNHPRTRLFLLYILTFLLLFLFFDICFPFRVEPRYSAVVKAADGSVLYAFLNTDDKWRIKTELSEISPTLRQAIVFKEDRWFSYHFGVNPLAIGRAVVNNILRRRRTSGASTITMQVVRLLEPRPRTYWSKIIEIFRAVQLELHYSKDEILQLYLNLIPFGSNIEGIKSASILYFQKNPDRLSLAEVTALSIIPNRPSSLRLGQTNAHIQQERNRWLRAFEASQLFEKQAIIDALAEPLTVVRHQAPKQAPHLAIRLKTEYPVAETLQTSIKPAKQSRVEALVKNYVQRLRAINIKNAAVLVLNNQTHTVEVYVGSADFENRDDGGQVDGIRAIRSPGSTLKPLLYGTAFERGNLTPKTMLNDVPTNFDGYQPENFDQDFHGKISVSFALANSLNIPAVKVLKDIGTVSLIEKLKKANFETIRKNSSKLGLSVVLGGCGTTLEELTNLFSAFANNGQYLRSSLLVQPNKGKNETLLTPEATFEVTQILAQITRPDLPNNYDYTYHVPRIAWKTGTSFGKKDAWSIGYNRKYTVGVWVGNFSGEGVAELSGANTATPLLFDIFNTIDYNSEARWFSEPQNLQKRWVCAESGDLPNEFCQNQVLDYAVMGVSKMARCQHLKAVYTNQKGAISYCMACLPDSGYVQKLYPNIAPELLSYYESTHIAYTKIPPHYAQCQRIFGSNAPKIIFPNDGGEYFIDRADKPQLLLSCQVANDVQTVYWYINDRLYQSANPQTQVFFKPEIGKVKISCVDDKGRTQHIYIRVKWV